MSSANGRDHHSTICPAGLSREQAAYVQRTGFERHIQTAIQVTLIGLCSWMALTTHNSSVSIATLNAKVESFQAQLSRLQTSQEDAYTNADATRDHALFNRSVIDLQTRVRQLEIDRLTVVPTP